LFLFFFFGPPTCYVWTPHSLVTKLTHIINCHTLEPRTMVPWLPELLMVQLTKPFVLWCWRCWVRPLLTHLVPRKADVRFHGRGEEAGWEKASQPGGKAYTSEGVQHLLWRDLEEEDQCCHVLTTAWLSICITKKTLGSSLHSGKTVQ
jgi:hypothetical protein